MKRITFKRAPLVLLGVALVAAVPALLDHPTYAVYSTSAPWTNDGAFSANGEPNPRRFPNALLQSAGAVFWRNYSPEKGVQAGRVSSASFLLKSAEVIIPIFGYPNSKYAGIYVESLESHRRYHVGPGAAHEFWFPFTVRVPDSLVNTPVRIVAFGDSPHVLIGVGTPYYQTNRSPPGVAFSKIFTGTLFSLSYLVLALFPFFYLSARLNKFTPIGNMMAGILLAGLAAFGLWFCAYHLPAAGRLITYLWLAISLVIIAYHLFAGSRRLRWPSVNMPLVLVIVLTLVQALFVFSLKIVSTNYSANYLFYPASWSTDNQIPTTTAQLLADGSLFSKWPFFPWVVSDRTPLLAAMLYPVAVVLRDVSGFVGPAAANMILQTCGFGLQNLWVVPAWWLFREARLSFASCIAGSVLVAGTAFTFFNSIYVWPKLLSATFCLGQYLFSPHRTTRRAGASRWMGVAACGSSAALAMLSHGGAVFAVAAIFVIAAVRMTIRQWWLIGLTSAIAIAIVVPWLAWTKAEAPSRNPLPKFLLTGDFGFSTPQESLTAATTRVYRGLSPKQWVAAKWKAARTLGGFATDEARDTLGFFNNPFEGRDAVRAYQFFCLLPCLGLLVLPLAWLVAHRFWNAPAAASQANLTLIELGAAAALACLVQFLVMMAPHFLHHYPYFTPLALHLIAIATALRAKRLWLTAVVLANYGLFIVYWILLPAVENPIRSRWAITLSLVFVAAGSLMLFVILLRTRWPGARGIVQRLKLERW